MGASVVVVVLQYTISWTDIGYWTDVLLRDEETVIGYEAQLLANHQPSPIALEAHNTNQSPL